MLYELFSWLSDGVDRTSISNQIVEQSDVDKYQQDSVEIRRKLLAEIRSIRFEKYPDSANASNEVKHLQQYESYQSFIDFFQKKIKVKNKIPLFILGMEYLLSIYNTAGIQQDIFANKIAFMFGVLLEKNNDIAIDFYCHNMDKFSAIKKIKIMVESDKTSRFLKHLTSQLVGEKNAIDVAPLFRTFIAETEYFSATLLWLLQQNVSEKEILQTNLLQDFMLYNLASLHAPDSPIVNLYTLLHQFPEARSLLHDAGQVRCEERGFQSYSLMGVRCDENKLQSIVVNPPLIKFTATKENFDALYQLFDESFLFAAIEWFARSGNQGCSDELVRVLNQVLSVDKISSLINQIARQGNDGLLKKLAILLTDTMLETMISKNQGSIMHLLPYKLDLYKKISVTNVKDYVSQVSKSGLSDYEIIPQFMAMFSAFKEKGDDVAVMVYDAIIDRLMLKPQFMDDGSLLKKLMRFDQKNSVLSRKYSSIEKQLDAVIDTQISLQLFTPESYQLIEDFWSDASKKISVINEISPVLNSFPQDKYAFQAHIANRYVTQHGCKFDLDEYTNALGTKPALNIDDVTEYERILIEVLTTVDDDVIRSQLTKKLKEKYTKEEVWINKKFGDESVFSRAVKQGNIGFLTWLESVNETTSLLVNVSAYQAAKANQWQVVDYFCRVTTHKPKQHVLNDILVLASMHGDLKTVASLCDFKLSRPHKRTIEHAFQQAVANHQIKVVQFFCELKTNAPSDVVLAKGFKQAIQDGQWELMRCIGQGGDSKHLQPEIDRAFQHACVHADIQLIKKLCDLSISPRQSVIIKSFLSAVGAGQTDVVNFLCTLRDNQPGQDTLKHAFRLAVESGHLLTVQYLCSCTTLSIADCERLSAYKDATKLGHKDIASYLKNLDIHDKLSTAVTKEQPISASGTALGAFGLFAEQKPHLCRTTSGTELNTLKI